MENRVLLINGVPSYCKGKSRVKENQVSHTFQNQSQRDDLRDCRQVCDRRRGSPTMASDRNHMTGLHLLLRKFHHDLQRYHGFIGVFITLLAYFLIIFDFIPKEGVLFYLMNIIGAGLAC
jgi:hypothetical protein